MVERIVSAGRDVLIRDGYAGFATNRVADTADVSPGSLYQYFHDKDELLAVVLDRYWDEVAERVSASLADRFDDPPDRLVRNTIDALLGALERDSHLLRVVVEEIPARRLTDRRLALRRRIEELVTAYLSVRPDVQGRIATKAWVIVAGMEGLAVRWVLDQPPIPRDKVVDELTALAERYVAPAA
ncbi:TetR/AcrR family transcriptional regulator [Flexivirga sp. ID2601S]|uniref:TetR/AcrR family transcriptional regulator n=2 Tax=Flexivirga aerilata TaxID=1656889 RepID=A0A849ASH6_9MICO|nr:TetR/AcrR family transcriptional regulator [Flexivirga aerilata]